MTDSSPKRRRPQVVRLDQGPAEEPETACAPEKTEPKPKRKSTPKKPRAPRTMVAPEPEQVKFDDPSSRGELALANHLEPAAKGLRWGSIFASCIAALISLGIGLWFTQLIEDLFARNTWLGWGATGLMGLAGLALLVMVVRELTALAKLRKLGKLRNDAEQALQGNKDAASVVQKLKAMYRGRRDMAWQLKALARHDGEIIDNDDRIKLAERELMRPLDAEAKRLIANAAKRISVVTAVNPAPALDVLFTGFQILRMLRQLAGLYGGRPGTLETISLARMVVTHLAVTGGMALSDTLIQNVIGHGLAGKLSSKLGEGTVNGIMTVRIGLAAMDLCRPLPYAALERPGLREFLSELTTFGSTSDPDEKKG